MNFEMESLTIHFFTPSIIRDIWCVNAQVSVEKNLSRLHNRAPTNVHLCQKSFNTEKILLFVFLIYFVLSGDLKKKMYFFFQI